MERHSLQGQWQKQTAGSETFCSCPRRMSSTVHGEEALAGGCQEVGSSAMGWPHRTA